MAGKKRSNRSRSRSQADYATNPATVIPRSSFDRSHGVKTAFDAGTLIPIMCMDVLPGDTMKLMLYHFARLATPLFPIMDNLFLDFHFWFVPNRLVWDNWERFCGAQDDPGDSTSFVVPQVALGAPGWAVGSLADYMGVPPNVGSIEHSALPLRGAHLIWNEWYRDQDLQDSKVVNTNDGPDSWTDYVQNLPRGKRHDYFTAGAPFLQKGPPVQLPLGTIAPVQATGPAPTFTDGVTGGRTMGFGGTNLVTYTGSSPSTTVQWDQPALEADLGSATAATINELRTAIAVQHLYEKDARGGTRYVEVLRKHFGVVLPDRSWRPEFLGGGTRLMNISQVPQTSSTDATTPQGNLAAYGVSGGEGVGFTHTFLEHGYVFGFVSMRADLNYQQGLQRHWSRETRWDFYWPDLQHIGEQAILSKELYLDGSAADSDVFAYTERFGEYKYQPSLITGRMRAQAGASLAPWHVAQQFTTRPLLDETFIVENPAIDRAIAVPSEPHVIFDGYFKLNHVRPMGVYSVPGLRRF